MSDSNEQGIVRGFVGLVGPDERPIGEAAKQEEAAKRPKRDTRNRMNDYATRQELVDGAATAALAVGEKMYEQMTEETIRLLEEIENRIVAKVDRHFYERSLRGRCAALVARVQDWGEARGWWTRPAPALAVVDAVDVLDPNVPQEGKPCGCGPNAGCTDCMNGLPDEGDRYLPGKP